LSDTVLITPMLEQGFECFRNLGITWSRVTGCIEWWAHAWASLGLQLTGGRSAPMDAETALEIGPLVPNL